MSQPQPLMDDKLIIQRLKELKAQIADIDSRLAALDDLLSDDAIIRYAKEISKILEEREPILNEASQWLLILNKKAPDIHDAEAKPN